MSAMDPLIPKALNGGEAGKQKSPLQTTPVKGNTNPHRRARASSLKNQTERPQQSSAGLAATGETGSTTNRVARGAGENMVTARPQLESSSPTSSVSSSRPASATPAEPLPVVDRPNDINEADEVIPETDNHYPYPIGISTVIRPGMNLKPAEPTAEEHKQALQTQVEKRLKQLHYKPPTPPPLLELRVLRTVTVEAQNNNNTAAMAAAISAMHADEKPEYAAAYSYLAQMEADLKVNSSFISIIQALWQGWDRVINNATLSIDLPAVEPDLTENMLKSEHFLAVSWRPDERRGILAIHVDEKNSQTILQVGVAQHGVLYITIPQVLHPEDIAESSMKEVFRRIQPFSDSVDPMAVIDGSYQQLNFSDLFRKSRVIRAPSGDTARLTNNLRTTAARDRLSAQNTLILNGTPASLEEYKSVSLEDPNAQYWDAWRDEAPSWNATIANAQFARTPTASRDALIAALTQVQNVIVIVAHCDGQQIFMPEPVPTGTQVTLADLRKHRDQIAANQPFVYLFACKAASLPNAQANDPALLENFASVLLECGAAGVIAPQTILPTNECRPLMAQLLAESRIAPPVEHFWQASRNQSFFKMEVFLA